ncbi:ribulokinase [candidate division KSB1 bacterium]
MGDQPYVIGVDFGTDSVRSIIVDTSNGHEIASSVKMFTRWNRGEFCEPEKNQFRQHPLDYIEGLEDSIKEALSQSPKGMNEKIAGISVDTTGSTPCAVDEKGIPLALTGGFEDNPNAMFVLWKDHTAVEEAERINHTARSWGGIDYTKYVGGVYSSEWFWAKILHIVKEDEKVREKAFSWVEHCDWIPALLTGITDPLILKRSRCAAGHKAMWHESFNGLPSEEFLTAVDPLIGGLRDRLYKDTWTCDVQAGRLSDEWIKRLGLPENVSVGIGSYDAHLGAVGAQIEPYILCKVIGTSTCDMLTAPTADIGDKLVRGICGQVDGSIIPGMLGMEAGQSGFGDVYAWFRDLLMYPVEKILSKNPFLESSVKQKIEEDFTEKIIPELSREAENIPIGESGIVALDWMNGRRTPYANQRLKGAVTGINLGTDAPKIFRSLVEATAFGAKKIVDRFTKEGIDIKGIIALGGIPKKSPFIMQVLCDVLNIPIRIAKSEQTCALGAAMAAAVCSGIYSTIEDAQKTMGNGFEKEYIPDPEKAHQYGILYESYSKLADFIENEFTRTENE